MVGKDYRRSSAVTTKCGETDVINTHCDSLSVKTSISSSRRVPRITHLLQQLHRVDAFDEIIALEMFERKSLEHRRTRSSLRECSHHELTIWSLQAPEGRWLRRTQEKHVRPSLFDPRVRSFSGVDVFSSRSICPDSSR